MGRAPEPRMAVVGHVEWVEFVSVTRVPRSGEIAHGAAGPQLAGGGGGVSAFRLARLAGGCTLFTALGADDIGARAREDLERRGVRVEAARRPAPHRRAVTFVEPDGERTITTIGPRLAPSGEDPLPWDLLDAAGGAYFTAGDESACRAARTSRVLVATSRVLPELDPWRVRLDGLVGSEDDPREVFTVEDLTVPPRVAVLTRGAAGGRYWTPGDGWRPYSAVPMPGAPENSYGAGDSFAAGLTYGLATGGSVEEALAVAARCGAEAAATGIRAV